jgi:hypothetical protein
LTTVADTRLVHSVILSSMPLLRAGSAELVAVILTLPACTAVTSPVPLTVASEGSALDQVTACEALDGVTVAESWSVVPTKRLVAVAVIETPVTALIGGPGGAGVGVVGLEPQARHASAAAVRGSRRKKRAWYCMATPRVAGRVQWRRAGASTIQLPERHPTL